jgi:hypothetical protein
MLVTAANGSSPEERNPGAAAWAFWGLIMLLALLSFVLRTWNLIGAGLLGMADGLQLAYEVMWWMVLMPLAVPAYATMGALVAARQPRNVVGWLGLGFAFAVPVQDAVWQYSVRAMLETPPWPGGPAAAWVQGLFGVIMVPLPLTLLILYFPNGVLPSRRWRLVVALALLGTILRLVAYAVTPQIVVGLGLQVPNPTGIPGAGPAAERLNNAGALFGIVAFLLAVASVPVRWRKVSETQRTQLKWFAYAGGLGAGSLVAAQAIEAALGRVTPGTLLLGTFGLAALVIGVPVAFTVAITRYHLFGIDRLIRRTLLYTLVTAILGVVYFGGVIVLQQVFTSFTGRAISNAAVVLSTLVIAALFLPLRQHLQAAIDRRFYRRKYDAARTLAAFAATCRDETDLDRLAAEMLRVVDATVQPEHASVWLRAVEPAAELEG